MMETWTCFLTGPSSVSKIGLYINDGNAFFTAFPAISGRIFDIYNIDGGDFGDFDNDGDLDLLLISSANSGRDSRLYRNSGNCSFDEVCSLFFAIPILPPC